jgi:hypothetical protein
VVEKLDGSEAKHASLNMLEELAWCQQLHRQGSLCSKLGATVFRGTGESDSKRTVAWQAAHRNRLRHRARAKDGRGHWSHGDDLGSGGAADDGGLIAEDENGRAPME